MITTNMRRVMKQPTLRLEDGDGKAAHDKIMGIYERASAATNAMNPELQAQLAGPQSVPSDGGYQARIDRANAQTSAGSIVHDGAWAAGRAALRAQFPGQGIPAPRMDLGSVMARANAAGLGQVSAAPQPSLLPPTAVGIPPVTANTQDEGLRAQEQIAGPRWGTAGAGRGGVNRNIGGTPYPTTPGPFQSASLPAGYTKTGIPGVLSNGKGSFGDAEGLAAAAAPGASTGRPTAENMELMDGIATRSGQAPAGWQGQKLGFAQPSSGMNNYLGSSAPAIPDGMRQKINDEQLEPSTGFGKVTLRDGGPVTYQDGHGGVVPGHGHGDKVPAKYEPGEFVVSNDMLRADPSLRPQLQGLRQEVLAQKGMTPEMADAKAIQPKGLRAMDSFNWDALTQQELAKGQDRIDTLKGGPKEAKDIAKTTKSVMSGQFAEPGGAPVTKAPLYGPPQGSAPPMEAYPGANAKAAADAAEAAAQTTAKTAAPAARTGFGKVTGAIGDLAGGAMSMGGKAMRLAAPASRYGAGALGVGTGGYETYKAGQDISDNGASASNVARGVGGIGDMIAGGAILTGVGTIPAAVWGAGRLAQAGLSAYGDSLIEDKLRAGGFYETPGAKKPVAAAAQQASIPKEAVNPLPNGGYGGADVAARDLALANSMQTSRLRDEQAGYANQDAGQRVNQQLGDKVDRERALKNDMTSASSVLVPNSMPSNQFMAHQDAAKAAALAKFEASAGRSALQAHDQGANATTLASNKYAHDATLQGLRETNDMHMKVALAPMQYAQYQRNMLAKAIGGGGAGTAGGTDLPGVRMRMLQAGLPVEEIDKVIASDNTTKAAQQSLGEAQTKAMDDAFANHFDTVNDKGEKVRDKQVEAIAAKQFRTLTGGRNLPPEQLQQHRNDAIDYAKTVQAMRSKAQLRNTSWQTAMPWGSVQPLPEAIPATGERGKVGWFDGAFTGHGLAKGDHTFGGEELPADVDQGVLNYLDRVAKTRGQLRN